MFENLYDHTKQTWSHVWEGQSTIGEKLEVAAEAAVVVGAAAVLGKFALTRGFSVPRAIAQSEFPLPPLAIRGVGEKLTTGALERAPVAMVSTVQGNAARAVEDVAGSEAMPLPSPAIISSIKKPDLQRNVMLTALPEDGDNIRWWKFPEVNGVWPLTSASPECKKLALTGRDNTGTFVWFGDGGAVINGKLLRSRQRIYFTQTDDLVAFDFMDNGGSARLQLMPAKLTPLPETLDVRATKQTEDFWKTMRLKEPIVDGFSLPGTFDISFGFMRKYAGGNAAVMVDRANDPVLRQTIQEAKDQIQRLGLRDPRQTAEFLAKFTISKMKPSTKGAKAMSDWHKVFDAIHDVSSRPILVGDYIAAGHGVCRHQAALLKVLADELNLDSAVMIGGKLQDGIYPTVHAFNYFKFPGIKGAQIFDTEANVIGQQFDKAMIESGEYVPASDGTRKLVWEKLSHDTKLHLTLRTDIAKKALPYYPDKAS